MNNKYVLVGIVVAIVVLLGGYFLLSNKATTPTQTENTQAAPTQAQTQAMESTRVSLTSSGFVPSTITIKAGTNVIWTNNSGAEATVSSDSHPTHLLWPFLNLGTFEDGSSVSVAFEEAGSYTYHNHLNPSQTGTVVVE